jgi:predicted nucleic acid-binding Zn ribbon protein
MLTASKCNNALFLFNLFHKHCAIINKNIPLSKNDTSTRCSPKSNYNKKLRVLLIW